MAERTWWETVEMKSGQVLERLQELIAEGNVRRVRIRQRSKTIAEFPLTVGVVGAVLAPMLAAIGALLAIANDCSIDVEKSEEDAARPEGAPTPPRPPVN